MKTSYSSVLEFPSEQVEIISFIFFTCILNVAICEESVEVNVDNTPVEPSEHTKLSATITQLKKALEEKEKSLKEMSAKFQAYKESQQEKFKSMEESVATQLKENLNMKKLIKDQEEQIKGLSTKLQSMKLSLKEAGKNFNLLQILVDFVELKVLPTMESKWLLLKKYYATSMEFVQTKWSAFCAFLATNESCQMFKRKALIYYANVVEFLTQVWNKVSPKFTEMYDVVAPYIHQCSSTVAHYYHQCYTAVVPYYNQCSSAMIPYMMKAKQFLIASWKQFKVVFSNAMETLFTRCVIVIEAVNTYLSKSTIAQYTDFITYCIVFGILRFVLLSLILVVIQVILLVLWPLHWICPCCPKSHECCKC